MAKIFVKLGKKASSFRDPSINLTIRPGQVVELKLYHQNAPRVKSALNGGYLVMVADPHREADKGAPKAKTAEELKEEFIGMVETNVDARKIEKYFKLEEFKTLAEVFDIELEEDDTKKSILEALMEAVSSDNTEE